MKMHEKRNSEATAFFANAVHYNGSHACRHDMNGE